MGICPPTPGRPSVAHRAFSEGRKSTIRQTHITAIRGLANRTHIAQKGSASQPDATGGAFFCLSASGESVGIMSRKKALTQEQASRAVDMYRRGASTSEIAKAYGCCTHTIRWYLKEAGVVFRPRNRLTQPVDVGEAAALYQSGATLSEIAERYDCSWMTIQRRLSAVGVDMHAPGCRYCEATTDAPLRLAANEQARKRYAAINRRPHDSAFSRGLSWRDIAERDHMRCQICGRKVDINDKWKNGNGRWCFGRAYPTIDHVIALDNGGTDTYDNVQLVCKRCNSKKGRSGQMRLPIAV